MSFFASLLRSFAVPSSPRVVIWTHEPLAEPELASILAQWPADSGPRRAIGQLIQEQLDQATTAISNPQLTAEQLRHGAGVIDGLQTLQARLEEYLAQVSET